jgi:hypothetical protein
VRIKLRYDDANARAALAAAPEVVTRRLYWALERGAQEIAREARGRSPKAFSHLVNSISVYREGDLALSVRPGKISAPWGDLSVRPGMNYAPWVEGGRMPMRKTGTQNGLLEWIRLKVDPTAEGKKLDRLGYVIARAISRRGIQPQPFMQPALEMKRARVVELADAAMRAAVNEINGGASGAG